MKKKTYLDKLFLKVNFLFLFFLNIVNSNYTILTSIQLKSC